MDSRAGIAPANITDIFSQLTIVVYADRVQLARLLPVRDRVVAAFDAMTDLGVRVCLVCEDGDDLADTLAAAGIEVMADYELSMFDNQFVLLFALRPVIDIVLTLRADLRMDFGFRSLGLCHCIESADHFADIIEWIRRMASVEVPR